MIIYMFTMEVLFDTKMFDYYRFGKWKKVEFERSNKRQIQSIN